MKTLNLPLGNTNLVAFISEMDENAMIAVKPFSDYLGLSWSKQAEKLRNNPQFTCALKCMHDSSGREQMMVCIPVRQIGMWLATINANRTKPEVREKLIQFQMHLQVVIHDAITGKVTMEVVTRLQQQLEEVKRSMERLQTTNENLMQVVLRQDDRIQSLEAENKRFIGHDASAAGSRMSHQRWAKRDKERLLQ